MRCFAALLFFTASLSCVGQTTASSDVVTVDRAIREALEKNLSLLAERYNVSVADARIVQARLRPNPVLSLGLDYQNFLGEDWTPGNQGPQEWNARVDYQIERGGKRARRVEVAQEVKEVARLELLNTTRGLVLDVENAFLDVQAARDALDLAKANLASLEEIARINGDRVRAGDLAKVEMIRSRVAALQARTAVTGAELKLRTAKSHLQLLLGRPTLSESFDVAGEIRHDEPLVMPDDLKADAFHLRPDLLALQRDQARSQADLRLQIAQGKIDYTFGVEYHHQYDLIHGDALGFFFSAPIPIFNRNQGEIERARQEDHQIETRIKAMQAQIANEVINAYQQYASSRTLLQSIEKDAIPEAKDVRQITEYSYKRGEASLLEFLDAQRAFNDTMQTYNDARADYARSLYLLDSVSGRGINP